MPTPKSSQQFLSSAARQARQLWHWCVSQLEKERRSQIVVALLVSLICAVILTEAIATTRSQRNNWATDVAIFVVTTKVAADELLTSSNTTTINMPLAVIPDDALRTLPANTRARISLAPQTPLTESLVIPSAESLVIPAGWRVIALPQDIPTPSLTPGDRVDVVIGTTVTATNSIVVSLEPLSLALPANVVPAVSAASRVGEVFLAAQK